MSDGQEFTIKSLGTHAEGIAQTLAGDYYIPFTLPGETVTAQLEERRGRLLKVITPSADRIKPLCRHYTKCGGCSLQHLAPDFYRSWKEDLVRTVFKGKGIDLPAKIPFWSAPLQSRRRCRFSAHRTKKTIKLGFHGFRSNDVVDMEECHVLEPRITALLPALRHLLKGMLSRKGEGHVHVTMGEYGADILLEKVKWEGKPEERDRIAEFVHNHEIARLTIDDETIVTKVPPVILIGGRPVHIFPGGFLQATEASQDMMIKLVTQAAEGRRIVADLYSGIGTFAVPLAAHSFVTAVENSRQALACLSNTVRQSQKLRPIEVVERDLAREPFIEKELEVFDCVVFDPPRAGAQEQVRHLANSDVPVVIGVSCNPKTLARDARILLDGGYTLERINLIDQFLYSAHIEAVAVFTKAK